jgi:tetratricopeptide (TPR) repeat protein
LSERLQEAARLYAARDYQAAEAVCRTLIGDDPRHFDGLHLLGVVLTLQQQPEQAVEFLRRAERERPNHPQLRVNLGNALLALKRYDEVVAVSSIDDVGALNNLGLAYRAQEQQEKAADAFRRATRVRREYAPAWFNLATTLNALDRPEEALAAANTALLVAPDNTEVRRKADITNEIGRSLMALGRVDEALATCRRFLQRYPGQPAVVWNMSLCLLSLGDFAEGWRAYEHRFGLPGHDERPEGAVVLDPDLVAGKRVLILTEQGRGDMLQFIRYAPLLAERGATVLVQAYPDLVDLVAAMPGVASVVSTADPRPEADLVTPVMSLPLAFGVHPATVPYLRVPADRGGRLGGARLGSGGGRRIGVAWSGSAHSHKRSAMPACLLAPLFALPGVDFHCLQKDVTEADQAWLDSARPAVARHGAALRDFADTAALIAEMDLVVTIDTAIVHLAGGLGVPTWLMLPANPDWRWLRLGADSKWYPTMRLFRQPERGAWEAVVRAVVAALTGRGG